MPIEPATPSVCERLRQDILVGAFPFGGRLKIDELSDRYTTSHMPIREALRQLQGEGLVVVEPNRGARVRAVDIDFVRDMFDLRIALESMLTRRAAERITPPQIDRIRRIEEDLEASVAKADFGAVLVANKALHAAINEAAGNVEAIRLLERHWNIIIALWGRHGYGAERAAGVISDHRQIIVALVQRDAEGAAILAAAHAAKAKQEMIRRFDVSRDEGTAE
ncbi:MAG: GntR family transcriptional regulator [Proteobacteria bacterium]|nr:GntR family transcriptional regulator [Pseudomonadota bacterium]